MMTHRSFVFLPLKKQALCQPSVLGGIGVCFSFQIEQMPQLEADL